MKQCGFCENLLVGDEDEIDPNPSHFTHDSRAHEEPSDLRRNEITGIIKHGLKNSEVDRENHPALFEADPRALLSLLSRRYRPLVSPSDPSEEIDLC